MRKALKSIVQEGKFSSVSELLPKEDQLCSSWKCCPKKDSFIECHYCWRGWPYGAGDLLEMDGVNGELELWVMMITRTAAGWSCGPVGCCWNRYQTLILGRLFRIRCS